MGEGERSTEDGTPQREALPLKEEKEAQLPKTTQDLEEALRQEHERAEDYLRRLAYLQAEFENYRKRVEKERHEMNQVAADKLVVSMLDVVDELEMAVAVAKKSNDKEAIVKGLEMVLRKFSGLLENEGLRPIESVGRDFDPTVHEVIQRVPVSEDMKGKVVEEVRKGYTLRGKVIRSGLVKVGVLTEGDRDKPS
jgi:molecular chaperone GrpE